jgi:anion-transporting  ArsA/GET3 family ATPase
MAFVPIETVPGIPRDARLHIVTGKGGTGKTTVAAALAIALSEGGRRTLLIEVEGRQALAQLFDVPALSYQERRLTTVAGGGQVLGLAIDPEEALLDYLATFYNLKRSGRALKRIGAVDFATTLAPGVRDVLLTGKVKEAAVRKGAAGRPAFDAVVLDAPPTGRIRQFLDATKEVANLTKFGPINRQSVGVIELLHSPRTAVHIVTVLEEMPVQETIDAATDLREAGYQLGAIVVNRVRPALVTDGQLGPDGEVDVDALARSLDAVGVDKALADPLARQMTEYAVRQATQAANDARLDTVGLPRIELPELTPSIEMGELNELADGFLEASPSRTEADGAA